MPARRPAVTRARLVNLPCEKQWADGPYDQEDRLVIAGHVLTGVEYQWAYTAPPDSFAAIWSRLAAAQERNVVTLIAVPTRRRC